MIEDSAKKLRDEPGVLALNRLQQTVMNGYIERQNWIRRLMDPRRDVDAECGHPSIITIHDYYEEFTRKGVGYRATTIWPDESWSDLPQIFETEDPDNTPFEEGWKELELQFAWNAVLQRADTLSGIGRYGIILLGLDDGAELSQPVPGLTAAGVFEAGERKNKLLYVRTFDETALNISEFERDARNPRYGQPLKYQVNFHEVSADGSVAATDKMKGDVHWSRVIHLADNRISSEVYGEPRMKKVFDYLLDLSKVAGGSAEMFWKGGFPGLSLETYPELLQNSNVEMNPETTKRQIENYMNGLQRYIATIGMTAKSLDVQIADPTPHLEVQLKLIATSLGIPWRVFVGSEAAQLASETDIRTWNRRVNHRRERYLSPYVILPTLRRLIDLGILPRPKKGPYVSWPDLNTPSDKDQAVVAEGMSKAMELYVASGADQLMSPFHFLTIVLKLTDEQALSVMTKVGTGKRIEPPDDGQTDDSVDE